jgi:flagellar hook-basal body complex protein FliE
MKDLEIRGLIRPPINLPSSTRDTEEKEAGIGPSFGKVLKDSIKEVNKLQEEAGKAVQDLATGKGKGIHETMIALEKADISFQMMMQIRNKIVEAYQEMMRMQF